MTERDTAAWLVENGGPAIRYRATRELIGETNLGSLERELLACPLVKTWFANLPTQFPRSKDGRLDNIHGGRPDTYESAMGRLVFLGCRAGMPLFDQRTQRHRTWLKGQTGQLDTHPFAAFPPILVASLLSMAGYSNEPEVRWIIRHRVKAILESARRKRCDIYIPWERPYKMPDFAKGRPLVNPELHRDGNLRLPWCHDINALTGLSERERRKPEVTAIIAYVLSPEYQRLPWDYGMLAISARRYMVSGWGVKLPGYFTKNVGEGADSGLPPWLLTMAHFDPARRHRWFAEGMRYLESFRTSDGLYSFPPNCLRWNLEAGRRTERTVRLESTFWMLKIRRIANATA